MEKQSSNDRTKVPMYCYQLKGITWVPHWLKPGIFVSPGYGRHQMIEQTAADLMVKGAKKTKEMLFPFS